MGLADFWREVANHARSAAAASVVLGTIGWTDAPDVFDLGTEENDGFTLVRVQLFAGRDYTRADAPGGDAVGQGHRLLCTVADHIGMFGPPRRGDRCVVLLPHGMEETAGAGVVVAIVSRAPTTQYSATRGKIDLGPDRDLVIKARSVTLTDHENRFIAIGPDNGVVVQDRDGSGAIINAGAVAIVAAADGDAKSVVMLSASEASIYQKHASGNTCVSLGAGKAQLVGTHCAVSGAAVYLGRAPTALTPAHYGPPGPGSASASVFISPA